MNKGKFISIVFLFAVLFYVQAAHAALNLIGQGTSADGTYNLIYDTDLNITWYDYTRSHDPWQNQVDWADALSVTFGSNTYTDWRLPITFDHSCSGYNCINSEMGHLYYTELGNTAGGPLNKTGDFQNLQPDGYWSGTEYSTDSAWTFYFSVGHQMSLAGDAIDALAVRPGLAVVPEPMSMILFGTGGVVLAARRRLSGWRHM